MLARSRLCIYGTDAIQAEIFVVTQLSWNHFWNLHNSATEEVAHQFCHPHVGGYYAIFGRTVSKVWPFTADK